MREEGKVDIVIPSLFLPIVVPFVSNLRDRVESGSISASFCVFENEKKTRPDMFTFTHKNLLEDIETIDVNLSLGSRDEEFISSFCTCHAEKVLRMKRRILMAFLFIQLS